MKGSAAPSDGSTIGSERTRAEADRLHPPTRGRLPRTIRLQGPKAAAHRIGDPDRRRRRVSCEAAHPWAFTSRSVAQPPFQPSVANVRREADQEGNRHRGLSFGLRVDDRDMVCSPTVHERRGTIGVVSRRPCGEVVRVRLEEWKPYEPELEDAFGWNILADPDPSEWLSTEELVLLAPYLDAVRDGREAAERADEALSRSQDAADDIERERACRDRAIAADALNDGRMQRQLLDRGRPREGMIPRRGTAADPPQRPRSSAAPRHDGLAVGRRVASWSRAKWAGHGDARRRRSQIAVSLER